MTTTSDVGSLPAVQVPSRPSPLLGTLTTLGVGGPAQHFVEATSQAEVLDALAFARDRKLVVHPLGGGSNLVVADRGVPGLVLRLATRGLALERDDDGLRITAEAGENWDEFTRVCCEKEVAGVECLGGIPGSVGATPIQNVGAYGQEVAETIERVRVVDLETHAVRELDAQACAFGYRDSYFKREGRGRFVVLGVTYHLRKRREQRPFYPELARALEIRGAAPDSSTIRAAVIELRRQKSMVLDATDENGRSCGSFFVNAELSAIELAFVAARSGTAPPAFEQPNGMFKVPSAWLIERAGLEKGLRRGAVGLSSKHTLSIVAHEGARASDVVEFARHVQAEVQRLFAVSLFPEPHFWGFGELAHGLPRVSAT